MEKDTKGVSLLRSDPKMAVVKLSLPIMIAQVVQALYNLVDSIWVAGLGPEALAGIGLFFPIFMIILAFSGGVGVGASSVISRKIGERNKEQADCAATYSIILAVVFGIAATLGVFPFLGPILKLTGATGKTFELAVDYSQVILLGITLLMFNNVVNGILRGEGDTKRSMYAISIGAVLNIFLDPLFIYTFGLGIKGAAYATIVSIAVSTVLMANWLFFRKDTYVSFSLKHLHGGKKIVTDILRVGIPTSFGQIIMSTSNFVLNRFIIVAGGDVGLAVFTSAWRIINFGTIPLMGIANAVTSVTGAAYGERNAEKLTDAYLFAVKFGLTIGLCTMAVIFFLASKIALIFTYSENTSVIFDDLVNALKILSFFIPTVPFGMFTSAMFQGIGHGIKSLAVSILRTIILHVFFSWLFVFVMHLGLKGVWWGMLCGNITAEAITFAWGLATSKKLKRYFHSIANQKIQLENV
ncbi:MAG TPA: MATE family efflux transporter [Pseudothermotoga sp.]|nr:MATE family efflux transporter [Pseudothermotoga sp.]HOK83481.1 MATE family efflux transporter [Pseudothermotoga sp.]HPP69554.1 MATE family efflux transporter [Pseudothermotoga sp.]